MELVIITPQKMQMVAVVWMELQTLLGNRVIQEGHAPMVLLLQPQRPFIFMPVDGAEQSIMIGQGTLEVSRDRAMLLIHEE